MLGSSRFHWMGPFSLVCTPDITPLAFFVVMWYIVSLFLRPPKGRKGRLPVATWYSVTPIDHKSTVAPKVLP